MRSARESMNATRGPMFPRLDLRYRNEQETNIDGFQGDYDLQAVELVLTYNLYRGGADSARRREFANRYYAAVESRKEACLSVRREVMIASTMSARSSSRSFIWPSSWTPKIKHAKPMAINLIAISVRYSTCWTRKMSFLIRSAQWSALKQTLLKRKRLYFLS